MPEEMLWHLSILFRRRSQVEHAEAMVDLLGCHVAPARLGAQTDSTLCFQMNILLFAPALFLAYLATQGFVGTAKQLFICASVQLILAYPFLTTYPVSYIKVTIFLLLFSF